MMEYLVKLDEPQIFHPVVILLTGRPCAVFWHEAMQTPCKEKIKVDRSTMRLLSKLNVGKNLR